MTEREKGLEAELKASQLEVKLLKEKVDALNARYKHHSATAVLEAALRDKVAGDVAMVSSFGAESVALLHLVAMVDRNVPVLFVDTQFLFTETLVYQQELAERLHLTNLKIITASDKTLAAEDPYRTLHQRDTDACCALRKTRPLQKALRENEAHGHPSDFIYDATRQYVMI